MNIPTSKQCYARIGSGHACPLAGLDQDHLEERDSWFPFPVMIRPSEEETKRPLSSWPLWAPEKKDLSPFRLQPASPASSTDETCWRSGGKRVDLPALPQEVGSRHH